MLAWTDNINLAAAHYWYLADYHEGQNSRSYSVLSRHPYNPGARIKGIRHESTEAQEYYNQFCERDGNEPLTTFSEHVNKYHGFQSVFPGTSEKCPDCGEFFGPLDDIDFCFDIIQEHGSEREKELINALDESPDPVVQWVKTGKTVSNLFRETAQRLQIELRDNYEEYEFSSHSCESCGSSLAGSRYNAHGLTKDKKTIHLDICSDCLLYHANGDEPENWEGP